MQFVIMASYLKVEVITFYSLTVYYYNLHDTQSCIITGWPNLNIKRLSNG